MVKGSEISALGQRKLGHILADVLGQTGSLGGGLRPTEATLGMEKLHPRASIGSNC